MRNYAYGNCLAIALVAGWMGCERRQSPPPQTPAARSDPPAAAPADASPVAHRVVLRVTSYWTVDEKFYTDEAEPAYDRDGNVIGEFPRAFLAAIRLEGWGRIANGEYAGRYLGYEPADQAYSLNNQPLDAAGQPLVAWQSAAAGSDIPGGSHIRLWQVPPEASPDLEVRRQLAGPFIACDVGSGVGPSRIDVYVGLQNQADMNRSPAAVDFRAEAIVTPPAEGLD